MPLCRLLRRRPLPSLAGLCAVLACALALSCGRGPGEGGGREVLTVSIPPQKWLLDSIVGHRFAVVSMLDAGSDPETCEPGMRQLAALQGSRAYFSVGALDFELAAMPRIRENHPSLRVVTTSAGIEPAASGHAHAHSHAHHSHAPGGDPHVWTSLPNARIMARNMYDEVVRLDPAGRDYYTARWRDLDTRLAALSDSVARVLAPLRGRAFMVWHPSLGYFARDYGLRQVSAETSGRESSPAMYRARLDQARRARPAIFFTQAGSDPRQALAMAAELGVPTAAVALTMPDIPAQIRILTHELSKAAH